MKAVIIAAGQGSRLIRKTNHTPKTLLPFGQETILSQILKNFNSVGIRDFIVVLGYCSDMILDYLRKNDNFGLNIQIIINNEYTRGNGISAWLPHKLINGDESFLLSMSDHLVSPAALEKIKNRDNDKNMLLVDTAIDEVFDIDDATKVRIEGERIIEIGKELASYEAVDCGIFKLKRSFFDALEEQIAMKKESISEGVKQLIENDDFSPVYIPDHGQWIDVDTPETYEHALTHMEIYTK